MSATLKVTRRPAFGIELRGGRFEILVDGGSVGSIADRETVETPLAPGPHTLRMQHGRYASPERSFDVAEGELIGFRCHGAVLWPTYVASILRTDLAISLRRK